MIVAPNFTDHWKTDLLVKITGSEESVRCLLRFWSHCQQQKTDRFPGLTPTVLSAICRWKGDANTFWDAMTQTYIDVKENGLCVAHEWRQVNSQLVTSWKNGKLGGRKTNNPRVTHGLPTGSPSLTHGQPEPLSNPSTLSPQSVPSNRRYPASADQALSWQPVGSSIPVEFVTRCFDKAESRGGKDAKGIPIADFNSFVRIEWSYEQERIRGGNGSTTAQHIQRTKRRDILAAKVKRLEGELQYEFERERFPDKVKELAEDKAELAKLETEILHDT